MPDYKWGLSLSGSSNYYFRPELSLKTKQNLQSMKLKKELKTKEHIPSMCLDLSLERNYWFATFGMQYTPSNHIEDINYSGWGGNHGYKGVMTMDKPTEISTYISAGLKYDFVNDYKDTITTPKIGVNYHIPHSTSSKLKLKKGFYSDKQGNISHWEIIEDKHVKDKVSQVDIFTGLNWGSKKGLVGVRLDGGISIHMRQSKQTHLLPYLKLGIYKKFHI